MVNKINELIEFLGAYRPGDILAASSIYDLAEEISKISSIPFELKKILKELVEVITNQMQKGVTDENSDKLFNLTDSLLQYKDGDSEKVKKTEKREVFVDDPEILKSFLVEAKEHLDTIEQKILQFEKDHEHDHLDSIFRSMHTIKGTSSFLALLNIEKLSHAFETFLDNIRNGSIEVNPQNIDLILRGVDTLNALIDFEKKKMDGEPVSEKDEDFVTEIEELLRFLSETKPELKQNTESAKKTKKNSNGYLESEKTLDEFISDSMDLLDKVEEKLLNLEKKPENHEFVNEAYRCIHTIKGNAGFLNYKNAEKICMHAESVFDSIIKSKKKITKKIITVLLKTVDSLRLEISRKIDSPEFNEEVDFKPIGEILKDMGVVSEDDIEDALDMQNMRLGELLVEQKKISKENLEKALIEQGKNEKEDGTASQLIQKKDIRVDIDKMERLFNLMGELITAEAMVIDNPEIKALNMDLDTFNKSASYLSKITREMQAITTSLRMIPLEGLFNKMQRLVRDLSRKFEKNIRLDISGQDTEMDRNVIELISDPLVHVIRNAADHGIESQDKRIKAGKPEVGVIKLNAKYDGNEIWISIKDDGAGLSREKIITKAVKNGILKSNGEDLTDKEVWDYIFEPGFSTAEKLSVVSGRGVGMDVVKKNLEKIKGKVDVNSVEGKGAEIILKIPLTLAIIDGVTVRVGNTIYAIPIVDVREFHKPAMKNITVTGENQEVLKLREDVIPIIKLNEIFKVKKELKKTISEGILLICESSKNRAAFLVDEIINYQQIVVRALPDYAENNQAISGCSIIGNGDIVLIIDTRYLITEEIV